MVTLVSAPGLLVFLVARSSFFTWATASIIPLNKRTLNRIGFISDVVPFCREYTTRAATACTVCVQEGGFEGPENGPKQRRINNRLLSYRPKSKNNSKILAGGQGL